MQRIEEKNILRLANELRKKEMSIFGDTKQFKLICRDILNVDCSVENEFLFSDFTAGKVGYRNYTGYKKQNIVITINDYGADEVVGTVYLNNEYENVNIFGEELELIENDIFNKKKNQLLIDSHKIAGNENGGDFLGNLREIYDRIKYSLELDYDCGLFLLNEKKNTVEFTIGDENLSKLKVHRESDNIISNALRTGKIQTGEKIGADIETEIKLTGPIIAFPIKNNIDIGVFIITGDKLMDISKLKFKLLSDVIDEIGLVIENMVIIKKLKGAAESDNFLRILTRKAIEEKIINEMSSKRRKKGIALIMLDLDNFKRYNDTHGHGKGDRLLKSFVEVTKKCTRRYDWIGRYGGDEFLILLTHSGPVGAKIVAERIMKECSEISDEVTCSIGVYTWDGSEKDLGVILKNVDEMLYRAKRTGKNKIVIDETVSEKTDKKIYSIDLFNEFLRKKKEERMRYNIPFGLLICDGDDAKILEVIRGVDIAGKLGEETLLLLSNTDEEKGKLVEARLIENKIKIIKREYY